MKKQIEITVPNDYSAITLKQYLKIQKDLENYADDKEAQDAFLLFNLCGITPEIRAGLDTKTINSIINDLYGLLNKTDFELQRKITIEGVTYGLEPNLSKMAYGPYLDISSYESIAIDENWPKILSILYRPVTKTRGALYEIEKYNGVEPWDEDKWYDITMDFHFGVFFYFLSLYKDLVKGILNSMKNHPEISPSIKLILEKSGEDIQQLHHLLMKTSLGSMTSLTNP